MDYRSRGQMRLNEFGLIVAQDTVAIGDIIGWGVMHIKSQARKRDNLIITYLTINRTVRHTKVLYEPPGGFYPLIVLPLGGKYQ